MKDKNNKVIIFKQFSTAYPKSYAIITNQVIAEDLTSSNIIFDKLENISSSITNPYIWKNDFVFIIWTLGIHFTDNNNVNDKINVENYTNLFTIKDVYYTNNVQYNYNWKTLPLIASPSTKQENKTLAVLIRFKINNDYNYEKARFVWNLKSKTLTSYTSTWSWSESCITSRPYWGSWGYWQFPTCWKTRGSLCKLSKWSQLIQVEKFIYEIQTILGWNIIKKEIEIADKTWKNIEKRFWKINTDENLITTTFDFWYWDLNPLDKIVIKVESETKNYTINNLNKDWNKARSHKSRNWSNWCTWWNWGWSRGSIRQWINVYYKDINWLRYCSTYSRTFSKTSKIIKMYKNWILIEKIIPNLKWIEAWNYHKWTETVTSSINSIANNSELNNFIINRNVILTSHPVW